MCLLLFGHFHLRTKQYEKALQYYEKSRTIYQEINAHQEEGRVLSSISNLYQELKQTEKVKKHLKKHSLILS